MPKIRTNFKASIAKSKSHYFKKRKKRQKLNKLSKKEKKVNKKEKETVL